MCKFLLYTVKNQNIVFALVKVFMKRNFLPQFFYCITKMS